MGINYEKDINLIINQQLCLMTLCDNDCSTCNIGKDIGPYDIKYALDDAINIMRKCQQIERIANRWKSYGGAHNSMMDIYEVLNGNND